MTDGPGEDTQSYGAPTVVKTPWGDATTLRERKLRPGRRLPPAEVARNQRERLFAALTAVVAEKGYEATRVADLLELSGVSRSAFYEHFKDKEECLLAALGEFVAPVTRSLVNEANDGVPSEERVRKAFETLIRIIVDQAPAARLCFVEIYAAGPRAVEEIDRNIDAFQAFAAETMERMPNRETLPPEVIRAMIGGVKKVIHTRLYQDEEHELVDLTPQLWDWIQSYRSPPAPIRRPRVRPPKTFDRGSYDPAERILRAMASVVADKGYQATTVSDVASRASISLSTFYSHFADKEEAMLAAVDSGAAQMLATTLPAFRRASDWPHAVRSAFGSMFAFCAGEPDFTKLGATEVYAAGRRVLEQRDQVINGMETLLIPGYEINPSVSPIAGEAIGGAIYSMTYDQVRRGGIEQMQEIAPLATYMTLAPFIGAKEACAVANGEGRAR